MAISFGSDAFLQPTIEVIDKMVTVNKEEMSFFMDWILCIKNNPNELNVQNFKYARVWQSRHAFSLKAGMKDLFVVRI